MLNPAGTPPQLGPSHALKAPSLSEQDLIDSNEMLLLVKESDLKLVPDSYGDSNNMPSNCHSSFGLSTNDRDADGEYHKEDYEHISKRAARNGSIDRTKKIKSLSHQQNRGIEYPSTGNKYTYKPKSTPEVIVSPNQAYPDVSTVYNDKKDMNASLPLKLPQLSYLFTRFICNTANASSCKSQYQSQSVNTDNDNDALFVEGVRSVVEYIGLIYVLDQNFPSVSNKDVSSREPSAGEQPVLFEGRRNNNNGMNRHMYSKVMSELLTLYNGYVTDDSLANIDGNNSSSKDAQSIRSVSAYSSLSSPIWSKALLYGSSALGGITAFSDIDLLLLLPGIQNSSSSSKSHFLQQNPSPLSPTGGTCNTSSSNRTSQLLQQWLMPLPSSDTLKNGFFTLFPLLIESTFNGVIHDMCCIILYQIFECRVDASSKGIGGNDFNDNICEEHQNKNLSSTPPEKKPANQKRNKKKQKQNKYKDNEDNEYEGVRDSPLQDNVGDHSNTAKSRRRYEFLRSLLPPQEQIIFEGLWTRISRLLPPDESTNTRHNKLHSDSLINDNIPRLIYYEDYCCLSHPIVQQWLSSAISLLEAYESTKEKERGNQMLVRNRHFQFVAVDFLVSQLVSVFSSSVPQHVLMTLLSENINAVNKFHDNLTAAVYSKKYHSPKNTNNNDLTQKSMTEFRARLLSPTAQGNMFVDQSVVVTPITAAKVPVLKFHFCGIDIDVIFAAMDFSVTPPEAQGTYTSGVQLSPTSPDVMQRLQSLVMYQHLRKQLYLFRSTNSRLWSPASLEFGANNNSDNVSPFANLWTALKAVKVGANSGSPGTLQQPAFVRDVSTPVTTDTDETKNEYEGDMYLDLMNSAISTQLRNYSQFTAMMFDVLPFYYHFLTGPSVVTEAQADNNQFMRAFLFTDGEKQTIIPVAFGDSDMNRPSSSSHPFHHASNVFLSCRQYGMRVCLNGVRTIEAIRALLPSTEVSLAYTREGLLLHYSKDPSYRSTFDSVNSNTSPETIVDKILSKYISTSPVSPVSSLIKSSQEGYKPTKDRSNKITSPNQQTFTKTPCFLEFVFKPALKIIKTWAMGRGCYGNVFALPPGVSYALMLARTCQLQPTMCISAQLRFFFMFFSKLLAPALNVSNPTSISPIFITKSLFLHSSPQNSNAVSPATRYPANHPSAYRIYGMYDSWSPLSSPGEEAFPVINPAYPFANTTFTTSKIGVQLLVKEFTRVAKFIEVLYPISPQSQPSSPSDPIKSRILFNLLTNPKHAFFYHDCANLSLHSSCNEIIYRDIQIDEFKQSSSTNDKRRRTEEFPGGKEPLTSLKTVQHVKMEYYDGMRRDDRDDNVWADIPAIHSNGSQAVVPTIANTVPGDISMDAFLMVDISVGGCDIAACSINGDSNREQVQQYELWAGYIESRIRVLIYALEAIVLDTNGSVSNAAISAPAEEGGGVAYLRLSGVRVFPHRIFRRLQDPASLHSHNTNKYHRQGDESLDICNYASFAVGLQFEAAYQLELSSDGDAEESVKWFHPSLKFLWKHRLGVENLLKKAIVDFYYAVDSGSRLISHGISEEAPIRKVSEASTTSAPNNVQHHPSSFGRTSHMKGPYFRVLLASDGKQKKTYSKFVSDAHLGIKRSRDDNFTNVGNANYQIEDAISRGNGDLWTANYHPRRHDHLLRVNECVSSRTSLSDSQQSSRSTNESIVLLPFGVDSSILFHEEVLSRSISSTTPITHQNNLDHHHSYSIPLNNQVIPLSFEAYRHFIPEELTQPLI